MNVLEKILEEIEERIKKLKEADNMCRVNAEHNRNFESMKYFQSLMFATERTESIIGDIIRSHMNDGRDTNVPSNDGWIPVEERLPEKQNKLYYDICIVTLENGEVCLGVYRNAENEWWTKGNAGREVYTNKRDVVAWQPLPTRYDPTVISKRAEDLRDRESFFTE